MGLPLFCFDCFFSSGEDQAYEHFPSCSYLFLIEILEQVKEIGEERDRKLRGYKRATEANKVR